MKFEIEEKVLQATITYLTTKPFNEVADLIQILKNSKLIKEEKKL